MNRPPHVLCALYPALGHLLPTLPVVEELVRAGCRVTATITPELEDRVRATGAETVPYRSSLETRLPDYTSREKLDEVIAALMNEAIAVSPVIDAACAEPPDVLVHDVALTVPGRVLAAKWNRPNVRILPIFASNEHFSIDEKISELAPPPPSDAPPSPTLIRANQAVVDYVHGQGLSGGRAGAALLGTGEFSVVFIPREFQIAGDTFGDDHLFVGPTFGEPSEDWRPPADGLPVVLISMGTSTYFSARFFADCAHAFADSPWHVVIALGAKVDPAELGPLPPNVEVHQWIPIGAVLRHASAYLCQGGISGIMESVRHGTAMVLVPRHPEQIANARRAEELGLGLVIDEAEVTPAKVREAVDRLRALPGLDENLATMRDLGIRAGGARRAAQAITSRALEPRTASPPIT